MSYFIQVALIKVKCFTLKQMSRLHFLDLVVDKLEKRVLLVEKPFFQISH